MSLLLDNCDLTAEKQQLTVGIGVYLCVKRAAGGPASGGVAREEMGT